MRPQVTLRKALQDPHLLGNALPGDSWKSWRTILIAAKVLLMNNLVIL